MQIIQSRRDFLATLSAAGAASVIGARASFAEEGPPEVTTIRLSKDVNICLAPWYIAEELLRVEGFNEIRYVPTTNAEPLLSGEIDFDYTIAPWLISYLDAGEPVTALAAVHSGCYELFAHEPIRTISDMKGRSVGVQFLGSAGHLLLAVMVAHVGLDPQKDINWIASPTGNFMALFEEGKVDAFLAFPPEPQELRARQVGRVILNTTTDQPWSQYFCCMLYSRRDFVQDHPVATKRFLRAILKAADICSTEPERAAQSLVDGGWTPQYDYALQTLTELPYNRWREFDPEDSLRFYALRLHEVGMIKATPNTLIAKGADWRFLNEIKRELKA
jgi:NitT/TauT family transport system substrate-binding protein